MAPIPKRANAPTNKTPIVRLSPSFSTTCAAAPLVVESWRILGANIPSPIIVVNANQTGSNINAEGAVGKREIYTL